MDNPSAFIGKFVLWRNKINNFIQNGRGKMTTISVAPSVKKAVKEIFDVLACKGMLSVYSWALIFFAAITGYYRDNILVLYGFLTGIVILLLKILWDLRIEPFTQYLKEWILEGGERTNSYNKAFNKGPYKVSYSNRCSPEANQLYRSEILAAMVLLGIIPTFFSCFVLAYDPFDPETKNHYVVVNSTILPIDSIFVFSSPLTRVDRISKSQTILAKNLQATTKDGAIISVDVKANLGLELSRDEILLFRDSKTEITNKLNARLQTAFTEVVSSYSIDTLPNDLLILSHLVHQKALNLLDGIPLVWSGEFEVEKPRISPIK